jgi:hypothetical protein
VHILSILSPALEDTRANNSRNISGMCTSCCNMIGVIDSDVAMDDEIPVWQEAESRYQSAS